MLSTARDPSAWSPLRRAFFRFAFVYLIVYSLPFPFGLIPGTEVVSKHYETGSDAALAWFGKNVLGIERSLAPFPTGSGDTTRSYVALLLHTGIAAVVALLWSLVWRRASHPRLANLLRTYVRFVLGATMLGYGTAKFFGGQFPRLEGAWLLSTWGDSSPMGVVWKFMGASPAYTVFSGLAECLGGLLLFWRRTTTIGALVTAGAMLNVVMINFCYDVPVKLYSTHLLLMAVGLALRDAPRLADALLWHRTAEPLPLRLPVSRWIFWPSRVLKVALVGWILFQDGQSVYGRWQRAGQPAGPLEGGYEVAEFVRDGTVVPPLLTDATRWRYVYLGRNGAQLTMTDGKASAYYQVATDAAASTVTLTPYARPGAEAAATAPIVLTYRREPAGAAAKPEAVEAATGVGAGAKGVADAVAGPEPAPAVPAPAAEPKPPTPPAVPTEPMLVLEGTWQGAAIRVRLRDLPADSFLVRNRGFRWIQEYPFNR